MTVSILDIFANKKDDANGNYNSVSTEYANLDIEWLVKDGNQEISTNTSWGNSTNDSRNLLVLVKGGLTVNSGYTLTAGARKRGMFIYVCGNCVIDGVISMTSKGATAVGQRLLLANIGSDYEVPAAGGAGGSSKSLAPGGVVTYETGYSGTSGVATGSSGGGGGGGVYAYGAPTVTSGVGRAGTSYSGGAGGGGASGINAGVTAGSGVVNGGAGGAGKATGTDWNISGGGGAGNPGGSRQYTVSPNGSNGGTGTGGLLVLYVSGTLTVSGSLESKGANGGSGSSGGGGSGGGHIDCFATTISGTPTLTVTGGSGGSALGAGGAGGAGSSRTTELAIPNLAGGGGFMLWWGFCESWQRHDKLWRNNKLHLPKDLGFSY